MTTVFITKYEFEENRKKMASQLNEDIDVEELREFFTDLQEILYRVDEAAVL